MNGKKRKQLEDAGACGRKAQCEQDQYVACPLCLKSDFLNQCTPVTAITPTEEHTTIRRPLRSLKRWRWQLRKRPFHQPKRLPLRVRPLLPSSPPRDQPDPRKHSDGTFWQEDGLRTVSKNRLVIVNYYYLEMGPQVVTLLTISSISSSDRSLTSGRKKNTQALFGVSILAEHSGLDTGTLTLRASKKASRCSRTLVPSSGTPG